MSEPARLWDFAGFDGLALARSLFGVNVSDLSAYQSMETECEGTACSLLRLCENNFRVSVYEDAALEQGLQAAAIGRRVWVKPSVLTSLLLDDGQAAWESLTQAGTAKPPHRLIGLPQERAVPVHFGEPAALVWRHPVRGVSSIEVQTAAADLEAVRRLLSSISFRSDLFRSGQ